MPLDGALFVSNPSMRQNNAKDRFIRAATGKSLSSIKALKSRDYEAYQDLFEEAGGSSAFSKRKKSKKTRMDKFFAALPDGDTRGKRRGRKSASAAKKTRSSSARKSTKKASSKKKLTPWTRFVKKHAGKGLSMAKLADMARKQGVIGKKRSAPKKRRGRRNPLVAGSAAQKAADITYKRMRDLQEQIKYARDAGYMDSVPASMINEVQQLERRMAKFDRAAASDEYYSSIPAVLKGRAGSRGKSSMSGTSKVSAPSLPKAPTLPQVKADIKKKIKAGDIKITYTAGDKCNLTGAYQWWVTNVKKPAKLKSTYQYYYKYLPIVVGECVKAGKLTKAEGDKLIADKKKQYRKNQAAKKSVSTSTRSTSVAKKKSKKSAAKKPMSLAAAARRGGIKKSIITKIQKGKKLTNGEFRSAFKGCGYTAKQLSAKWKRYKNSFGVAAPKKKKASSKKKRAAARGKASASGINKSYIMKLLKARRRKQKGVKVTLSKAEKKVFDKAVPHMIRIAKKFMKDGDSKYAAVNKAITRSRSGLVSKSGKRTRYKGVTYGTKGAKRYFNNPRRRRNAAVVSFARVPVIGQIKPFARVSDLNNSVAELVSGVFGRHAGVAYGSVVQGLKMAEIAGVHYFLGAALDKPIDWAASVVDNATGMQWASWLSENAYYSLQGLVALLGIGVGQRLDLFSQGSVSSWGVPAFAIGVAFDVASKLAKGSADKHGVHMNGYGDGGQYMVAAPATVQLTNRLPAQSGYGALQMNPRAFGAVHANPGYMAGAEGAMGAGGAAGAPGYGAVLFSGSGY